MAIFDEIDPLESSASPGLAPLPSEVPSPGLAPDAVVAAPPAVPPAAATPPSSGLGMADFKSARSSDDRAYLESLPMAEKIGLVLQSFGAGVQGQPNPIDAMLEAKRRREAEFRNEFATTIKTITTGMDAVRKMPPGKARDALIEQIARSSGGTANEVRNSLLAVGTAQEQAVRDSVSALGYPAAEAIVVKMSGGDPKKAIDILTNPATLKVVHESADRQIIPSLTAKMAVLSRAMEKMPQFKGEDGRTSFTIADLREQNGKLPQQYQLTDAELGAANRNQASLIAYGMRTDKTLQDEQSSAAKREDTGEWSEPYMMNGALVQKNSATGQIKTAVARAPQGRPEPAPTVVKIQDPNDSKKTILIDARTRQKIGDAPAGTERNIPAPVLKAMAENDGNVRRATMALRLVSGEDVEMPVKGGKPIKLQGDQAATGVKGYLHDDLLQRMDPKGVDARAVIGDLGSMVIHDRSGAAVTAAEYPRLKPFIPLKTDDGPTIKRKLARFVAEYTAINEELRGMFSEDQGYRQPPSSDATKGDTGVAAQAKAAWGAYEPDKYEYRMANGKLQRKAK
jgi:hypothetical protein